MRIRQNNVLGELGSAIGMGLLAGLAGTAAITLSQMIEMRITKRGASDAPVKVVKGIMDVKPTSARENEKVGNEIHWAYGTSWGVARGLISLMGLRGAPATIAHFAAVWGMALVILPKYKAAKPITEEDPKAIGIDVLHHAVYAIAAGCTYDALDAGSRNERKVNKLMAKLKGWKKRLKIK